MSNDEGKKTKKKLSIRLKENLQSFISIFKEYPVTIGCLMVAALLGSILIDANMDEEVSLNMARCAVFLCIWAAGTLFTEELFRVESIKNRLQEVLKFWACKGGLFLVTAGISFLFVRIFSYEYEKMFGIIQEQLMEIAIRYLIVYCTTVILTAIYLMYKRNKVSFSRYCIDVFSSVIKTTVVYGLFALGIAAIILVFNILIYDTDMFMARAELFLASGIYVPAIILAVSRTREEIGKFAKVVVEYVLLPLLLAAFVVIYIYIFKLVIQWKLPSNEVFAILAWLFGCGLPIWTMAINFENQVLGKIAKYLPFVFCPFVILQVICIGLRVSAYGITMSRYMGLVLIVFEVIYIGLYIYKIGKIADLIVPVTIFIVFVVVLLPGMNMFDTVIRSQGKRLLSKMEDGFDNLSDKEKNETRSIYYAIYWDTGYKGNVFLDEHFSEKEQEMIRSWYSNDYSSGYRMYYSSHAEFGTIDISEFNKITYACHSEYDSSFDKFDEIVLYSSNEQLKVVDLTEMMEAYIQADGDYDYLKEHNLFRLDTNTYYYVTYISLEVEDDHYDDFRIEGYLLEK